MKRYLRYFAITSCVFWRWFVLIGLVFGAASSLQAAPYADNGNGTETDTITGLTWMRCSMGQVWNGAACIGTPNTYTWEQAKSLTGTVAFAGQSDWRLPTIRELQSIVDYTAAAPQINTSIFPQTPNAYFWSNSVYAGDSSQAWHLRFNTGETVSDSYASGRYNVRLTRGGPSGVMLSMARPTGDYVDNGNGTATHTPTGLMWQRCAKGQTWTDSTCSGAATAYDGHVASAMVDSFAGYTDWRLPTITELATLVDYASNSPAANTSIFPALPSTYFWSKTPDTSGQYGFSTLWLVHFGVGAVTPGDINFPGYDVRLVRSSLGGSKTTNSYNLASDFSLASNPNGSWSYGYKLSSVSQFQLFDTSVANAYGVAGLQHLYAGALATEPHVIKNNSNISVSFRGTVTIDAGDFQLHPGPDGQMAVVRWTSPSIGTFLVAASFRGNDSTSTLVDVRKNDVSIFAGAVNGQGPGLKFSTASIFAVGDTLDFIVDANGPHQNDSTGLAVSITSAVSATTKFAYVANSASNTVSSFTISSSNGALSAGAAFSAGTSPLSLIQDPSGKFLYAANWKSNNVSVYSINQSSGDLSAIGTVPTGIAPLAITFHPAGKFAFVANEGSDSVSVYTVNLYTGALTAGTAIAAGSHPRAVAVDRSGRFVYVANYQSNDISIFSIDQGTGALTQIGMAAAGTWPHAIAIDPSGKFAYVANSPRFQCNNWRYANPALARGWSG